MRRIILAAVLTVFAWPTMAQSSIGYAYVVASCGTLAGTTVYKAGDYSPVAQDINGNLCTSGSGGGGGLSITDNTAFTYGTSKLTPIGGVYNSSITPVTNGYQGAFAMTSVRSLNTNTVQWAGGTLGAMANYGTSPGAVLVPGVNANTIWNGSDGSSTITSGGTAQNLFSGATPANGMAVYNPDASEDCWVSLSTTAVANGAGSIRVAANGGGYETPPHMRPFHAVSLVCATTGHKFTAIQW